MEVGRRRRRRRGGRGGRGGVDVLEGAQAGDRLCLPSPVPAHQEPAATPMMAVPLPTWQSRQPRPGLRGRCALARLAGVPAEGARGDAGTGGGPRGRRDWGEGAGPPPPAPCPRTRSSRPGGKSWRCPLRAPPARRAAPTCGVRGAPPPRRLSFLLLRKPPAQLHASRTGGAGTPGQGASLAAGDM